MLRLGTSRAATLRVRTFPRQYTQDVPQTASDVHSWQRLITEAADGTLGRELCVGGLDDALASLFRRVFVSRLTPPSLAEQIGMRHVKGILLSGPPGTGKTLIARRLAEKLSTRKPKVVNGPEIFNHLLGSSEQRIRELFRGAEDEWKRKKNDSALHVIIIDEIDAISRRRGGEGEATAHRDAVVNQLLTKLDGLDSMNNVLVVGTTNRKDLLDEALLRPGRLEVHINLPLPDGRGREDILRVHARGLIDNGLLDEDVDLAHIALNHTSNYTGAELEGVVLSAVSNASERYLIDRLDADPTLAGGDSSHSFKVTMQDFAKAIREVKPAYGGGDGSASSTHSHTRADISPSITHSKWRDIHRTHPEFVSMDRVCRSISRAMASPHSTPSIHTQSILLHAPAGVGKLSVAIDLANSTHFPFLRVIRADRLVGLNLEAARSELRRVFNDSDQSRESVIVLADIDKVFLPAAALAELTPSSDTPSTSTSNQPNRSHSHSAHDVLPASHLPSINHSDCSLSSLLLALLARRPPPGYKRLVIATSNVNANVMRKAGILSTSNSFTHDFAIPGLSKEELREAISDVNFTSSAAPSTPQGELRDQALQMLPDGMPVAELALALEIAAVNTLSSYTPSPPPDQKVTVSLEELAVARGVSTRFPRRKKNDTKSLSEYIL